MLYFKLQGCNKRLYKEVTEARIHRYEAYLDSYITPADLYFLSEAGMARQLVELG